MKTFGVYSISFGTHRGAHGPAKWVGSFECVPQTPRAQWIRWCVPLAPQSRADFLPRERGYGVKPSLSSGEAIRQMISVVLAALGRMVRRDIPLLQAMEKQSCVTTWEYLLHEFTKLHGQAFPIREAWV